MVSKSKKRSNTTAKGDKFEAKIADLFSGLIAEGLFFAGPDRCKVFKKKGYYSHLRKKNIITDVSIEVFNSPTDTEYAFLFIIECKDYSKPLQVKIVEEFHAKIAGMMKFNIKGVIASTNEFQEGFIEHARSVGIGLFRYFAPDNFKWVLNRSPSSLYQSSIVAQRNWIEVRRGLLEKDYVSSRYDFFGCNGTEYTNSINAFFLSFLNCNQDVSDLSYLSHTFENSNGGLNARNNYVDYLSKEEINIIAESYLNKIDYKAGAVPLKHICDLLISDMGLKLRTITKKVNYNIFNNEPLGSICFAPLEIILYEGLDDNPYRKKFTLAHEIGHLLLGHEKYIKRESCDYSDLKVSQDNNDNYYDDLKRLDWQANYFASCLILPQRQFTKEFYVVAKFLDLRERGFGLLYVDQQWCNIKDYNVATNILRQRFGVSRSVVRKRLLELGFLRLVSDEPIIFNRSSSSLRRISEFI